MFDNQIVKLILKGLMRQEFVEFYEGEFIDFVEGTEGCKTESEIRSRIKAIFEPARNRVEHDDGMKQVQDRG